MSASKSDRSTSPAAVSEDSRRELLARQHRALYGNESPAFFPPGAFSDDNPRPDSQAGGGTPSSGVRGSSPRGMDPFGLTQAGTTNAEATTGLQSPSRANSTSSPSSAINASFGTEQPVTSASSPGADSPSSRQATSKPAAGPIGSVGPIGSRPAPGQTSAPPATRPGTMGNPCVPNLPKLCATQRHFHSLYDVPLRLQGLAPTGMA